MKDEKKVNPYVTTVVEHAKVLSDQELDYLIDKLYEEQEKRKDAERLADWKAVCDAIDNFTRKHGSLFVQENNNPLVVEGVNLLPGKYSADEFGVITVKH